MDHSQERRLLPRTRSIMRGVIHTTQSEPDRSCSILDHSDTGARLSVADTTIIPNRFVLNIPLVGSSQDCRVVWRKPGEIGVQFEQGEDDITRRIESLEAKVDRILEILQAMQPPQN